MNVSRSAHSRLPNGWPRRTLHASRRSARAFTLLEIILALMIFSIAVVSLVSAINGMGQASVESRQTRELESKVENTLLETTRMPPKEILAGAKDYEKSTRDGAIETKIRIDTLNWQTADGQAIPGLYMVKVTARPIGRGGDRDAISGECVLYPPLYNAHP